MNISTSESLPQVAPAVSETPITGVPYNFNRLMRGVHVPIPMLSYRKLPPGARLLWGLIRAVSHYDGTCTASKARLERIMGVSRRQIMRWLAALTKEGFLKTVERPGRTPSRLLLWHDIFAISTGKGGHKGPPGGPRMTPGGARNGPRSKSSVQSSVLSVGREGSTGTNETGKREGKMATAREILGQLPAALTDSQISKGKANTPKVQTADRLSQLAAIEREVKACGFPLTKELLSDLERKQRAYGVTGYQTAAAIARALRKIAGKKTFKARSDRWIVAVVESDFATNYGARGPSAE